MDLQYILTIHLGAHLAEFKALEAMLDNGWTIERAEFKEQKVNGDSGITFETVDVHLSKYHHFDEG